jgi:hypothetical protein
VKLARMDPWEGLPRASRALLAGTAPPVATTFVPPALGAGMVWVWALLACWRTAQLVPGPVPGASRALLEPPPPLPWLHALGGGTVYQPLVRALPVLGVDMGLQQPRPTTHAAGDVGRGLRAPLVPRSR